MAPTCIKLGSRTVSLAEAAAMAPELLEALNYAHAAIARANAAEPVK